MASNREMGRYFGFICYPESMPSWDQVFKAIREFGMPIALSPLHDKDEVSDYVEESDGITRYKKAHFHGIACWENTTTTNNASETISKIFNGTRCIRLGSPIGMYRYHCHLDDPDKFPYPDSDRLLFNGFSVNDINFDTASDRLERQIRIDEFIMEHGIFNYSRLIRVFLENDQIEDYDYVSKHSIYYRELLRGLREDRTGD